MAKEERKYEEVFAELENLVATIEKGEGDPAALEGNVRKAVELIAWCREYLRCDRENIEKNLLPLQTRLTTDL